MESLRISKIMDLMGKKSISEIVSKLFTINGVKCDKVLISELYKNVYPENERTKDEEFVEEIQEVVKCFFS